MKGRDRDREKEVEQEQRIKRKKMEETQWPLSIANIRKAYTAKLLKEEKLVLILDLDHTLLHSTQFRDVSHEEEKRLLRATDRDDDHDPIKRRLFRVESMRTWTMLRPFVHEFLKEANEMFDLYIYTMGIREYAVEMARLLDAEEGYFKYKIIAREDSTEPDRKRLDKIFAEESIVLILDDTKEVWKSDGGRRNVIQMPKYNFFGSTAGSEEEDRVLETTLDCLKQFHKLFFEFGTENIAKRDTREILRRLLEMKDQPRRTCQLQHSFLKNSISGVGVI